MSKEQGAATRARILEAIRELTIQHGVPPTYREVMAVAGIASTGQLHHHLSILTEQGVVEVRDGRARGLRLVGAVTCPGCAARDGEIARLRAEVTRLNDAMAVGVAATPVRM